MDERHCNLVTNSKLICYHIILWLLPSLLENWLTDINSLDIANDKGVSMNESKTLVHQKFGKS